MAKKKKNELIDFEESLKLYVDSLVEKKFNKLMMKKESKKPQSKVLTKKQIKQSISDITKQEINDVLSHEGENPLFEDIFGNKCILSQITKDHVYPKAKDGPDISSNIIMLCKESNKLKGNKTSGKINNKKFEVINSTYGSKAKYTALSIDGKNIILNDERERFELFMKNHK